MPAPKGHAPYPGSETGGSPKIHTKEFIDNEARELEEWMHRKPGNVFLKDFCFERKIKFQRISEWVKCNEKFADAYEWLMMKQETSLIKGGLYKKLQYNMCALVLSNFHGIVAKSEQKITGSIENPLAFAYNNVKNTSKDLVDESK